MSSQVHQGNAQEIQNGRFQTRPYSDGNRLQIENRRLIQVCGSEVVQIYDW